MGEEAGVRRLGRTVLGEVLQRFIEQKPITVMVRATLQHALNAEAVDVIFKNTAEAQYTRELTFSMMVDLMGSVVCGGMPNIHAAYQDRVKEMPAKVQAVYKKLAGVEPAVCAALVRDTSKRLGRVVEAMGGQLPALLPGRRLRILDGNHQPAAERRIKELRGSQAGPLPSFCLVVLDPSLMLATDIIPCEDGHAQERSLTSSILALVQAGDVWMDDRNFCTVPLLFGIADADAFFIKRHHAGMQCWRGIGRRRKLGRTDTGMVYEQEVLVWNGDPAGRVLHVRRITIVLDTPTRDGATELHPDEPPRGGSHGDRHRGALPGALDPGADVPGSRGKPHLGTPDARLSQSGALRLHGGRRRLQRVLHRSCRAPRGPWSRPHRVQLLQLLCGA